ncbi:MAG: tyrosine-type recombinase/integrase [Bacteroidales bacterium]
MSKKLSITTADYLTWDQNLNLIRKLIDDNEYRIALLISFGSFWGLRISDILRIRWIDVFDKNEFDLVEGKTQKSREIRINVQLQKHIHSCYDAIKPATLEEPIFLSQKKTIFSIQRVNVLLKEIKSRYGLKIRNFSSHSLRKTFGREVFEASGTSAELSLVKLCQLFNHSNTAITRRYLGIAHEELMQTYDILKF